MSPRAKALVRVSLAEYKSAKSYHKKASLAEYVRKQLIRHDRGINSISSGFAPDYVIAGKIFLRLINNLKP